MLFYAVGSFFSGNLGDTYNPSVIVGLGLIGKLYIHEYTICKSIVHYHMHAKKNHYR